MKLVNATPLVADLTISKLDGERVGYLIAKATYRYRADGSSFLDTQDPLPIRLEDAETELGVHPADQYFPGLERTELLMLAHAGAPSGKAVRRQRVSVGVADRAWHMDVHGDRNWEGDRISEAQTFERMPLTWERAFGGGGEIEIDREAFLDCAYPFNRHGRGYDMTSMADSLKEYMGCLDGYPKWERDDRLPNLENPDEPIRVRSDMPRPWCWSAAPVDVPGLHTYELREVADESSREAPDTAVKKTLSPAQAPIAEQIRRGVLRVDYDELRSFRSEGMVAPGAFPTLAERVVAESERGKAPLHPARVLVDWGPSPCVVVSWFLAFRAESSVLRLRME